MALDQSALLDMLGQRHLFVLRTRLLHHEPRRVRLGEGSTRANTTRANPTDFGSQPRRNRAGVHRLTTDPVRSMRTAILRADHT